MIIWSELEEHAELEKAEVAAIGYEQSDLADFIEEHESDRPLRRRLASAIVSLGIKIDPKAVEDLTATEE